MLKVPKGKNSAIEFLHRFFVNSMVGVTVVATGLLAFNLYNHFVHVRPQLKIQRKLEEEKLLNASEAADTTTEGL